jgi:hypothetical protein
MSQQFGETALAIRPVLSEIPPATAEETINHRSDSEGRSTATMVGSSKDTGSTWVYNHHETGKWPVVICHDELAPKKFISKRKERRWLAAIQLGRHKL